MAWGLGTLGGVANNLVGTRCRMTGGSSLVTDLLFFFFEDLRLGLPVLLGFFCPARFYLDFLVSLLLVDLTDALSPEDLV